MVRIFLTFILFVLGCDADKSKVISARQRAVSNEDKGPEKTDTSSTSTTTTVTTSETDTTTVSDTIDKTSDTAEKVDSGTATTTDATTNSLSLTTELKILPADQLLPVCSNDTKALTYFLLLTSGFEYCDGSDWTSVNLKGDTGDVGTTGSQGPAGPQGIQGPAGAGGSAGATGSTGPTGAKGVNGLTGAKGPTGLQGPAGTVGLKGATGDTGPTGAKGAKGVIGDQGLGGNQGSQGLAGVKGDTGDIGLTGATGSTGAKGATGSSGAQGPAGANGAAGKNSLLAMSTEAAGANCTVGGKKIDSGIDTDGDASLGVGEINATNYVCKIPAVSTTVSDSWTPASESLLKFWLDASQESYSNDDPVSTGTDHSGSGYDVTNTGSNRPTFKTNILNGHGGYLFASASAQYLKNASVPFIGHPITFAVVAAPITWDTEYRAAVSRGAVFANNSDFVLGVRANGPKRVYEYWRNGSTVYGLESAAFYSLESTSVKVIFVEVGSDHTLNASVDGVNITSNLTSAAAGSDGSQEFRVGAPSQIGGSDNYWNGYIFEIAIWNKVLDNNAKINFSAYVRRKWGLRH